MEAARREFLDLGAVMAQLQETSFYVDPDLFQSLLDEEVQKTGVMI